MSIELPRQQAQALEVIARRINEQAKNAPDSELGAADVAAMVIDDFIAFSLLNDPESAAEVAKARELTETQLTHIRAEVLAQQ